EEEPEPRPVDPCHMVARANVHRHRPRKLYEQTLSDVDTPRARVTVETRDVDQGAGHRPSIAPDAGDLAGDRPVPESRPVGAGEGVGPTGRDARQEVRRHAGVADLDLEGSLG